METSPLTSRRLESTRRRIAAQKSVCTSAVAAKGDPGALDYPPNTFWAELEVRTLAQHVWCEMSHDSVYKNDEMVAALPDDIKRRVNLMAGQIEVADREFDRLDSELK